MNDSGIIGSYQEEKELELPQPEAARLATVQTVGTNGLRIIFDGETASNGKDYLCNTAIKYKPGDRVLVQKVGGSYIVVCTIGKPTANSSYRTIRVDNMAGNYGDLEFAMDTQGVLWVNNVADTNGKWTKLSGTATAFTGTLNRPSWP